jgi:hypothetical protein
MPTLNEILGTLPNGMVAALSDDAMTKHLREVYINSDAEKNRRDKTRMRIDLYNDKGAAQIRSMIDEIFRNTSVRDWQKKFAELASFQNLTKRVIREISAVYSEPATRSVRSERMNRVYRTLIRNVRMDRRMRLANQMVNLCNEAVLWFDLAMGKPVLRVVTPDNFWAVAHPNDPCELAALIFDKVPGKGVPVTVDTPFYLVVSDSEQFCLNQHGRLLPETRKPIGMSRMPMVLVHRVEPTTELLCPDPGNDIIAAHKAIALINTMMLKHQKSGTKQAYAAGDVGDMPMGQPMDEEHLLQAPEGVSLSTLDLGADPSSYITAARAVIKQIAANYGIPESVFDLSYQATSGFEIELKRTGLREVRRDQILDWRPVEFELSEIMSEALAESGNPLAFNTDGWSIDFGEVETPQDPMARLSYWEKLRQMGLMNTREMYMAMNPEASESEADAAIVLNAAVEAERVSLFRSLNMSPSTPADGSDGEPEDSQDQQAQEMPQ